MSAELEKAIRAVRGEHHGRLRSSQSQPNAAAIVQPIMVPDHRERREFDAIGEMEKAALERRHEHEQDQAADDGFGHGPDPLIRLGGEDRCKGRRSIVLQLVRIDFLARTKKPAPMAGSFVKL